MVKTDVKIFVRPSGSTGAYTELTPYIALGGLKWQRNDVEASKAGRDTQDGIMHRSRVGIKIRLDLKCRPLTTDEARIVLQAIKPVWLEVLYLDPMTAGTVQDPTDSTKTENKYRSMTCYSNNIPATFLFMRPDGSSYWEGIEFPLIEK